MKRVASFLQVTFLWILLLPIVSGFLGTMSNQFVLWANHGKFPVMLNSKKLAKSMDPNAPYDGSGMIDDTHCVMTPQTHLNFLADILDFDDAIESVGDQLIDFSVWLAHFCPFVWGALVVYKLESNHNALQRSNAEVQGR